MQTKFVEGGGGVTKTIAKQRILGFDFHYLPLTKQPEPTRTKKRQLLFLRLSENKNSETNIAQHSTKKKKKRKKKQQPCFPELFKRWTKLNNSTLPIARLQLIHSIQNPSQTHGTRLYNVKPYITHFTGMFRFTKDATKNCMRVASTYYRMFCFNVKPNESLLKQVGPHKH